MDRVVGAIPLDEETLFTTLYMRLERAIRKSKASNNAILILLVNSVNNLAYAETIECSMRSKHAYGLADLQGAIREEEVDPVCESMHAPFTHCAHSVVEALLAFSKLYAHMVYIVACAYEFLTSILIFFAIRGLDLLICERLASLFLKQVTKVSILPPSPKQHDLMVMVLLTRGKLEKKLLRRNSKQKKYRGVLHRRQTIRRAILVQ